MSPYLYCIGINAHIICIRDMVGCREEVMLQVLINRGVYDINKIKRQGSGLELCYVNEVGDW
jgi:hypothetical protein